MRCKRAFYLGICLTGS